MEINQQLIRIQYDLYFFIPEICLSLLFICQILFGLIFRRQQRWLIPMIAFVGICFTFYTDLGLLTANKSIFADMLNVSPRVVYFKILFEACGLLVLIFSVLSRQIKENTDRFLEYFSIITAIILGSHLLVMSSNLLMVLVSLEIISIGSFILVNFIFNRKTAEAALKYVLFGMLSSGIMLYGISLLFGFTGTLNYTGSDFVERIAAFDEAPVLMALGLTFAGVLFKISVFPFHLWTPDVYEGTPHALVAFFSTVTKVAGFGLLLNFMPLLHNVDLTMTIPWFRPGIVAGCLAIVTICIGNFAALRQHNFKRMLGYSAIAQSGFILLPLCGFSEFAYDALIFYLTVYTFMSFSVFFVAQTLSEITESDLIDSYQGLGQLKPILGISTIITMVSLVGLPPAVGFIAKFVVFTSVWETYISRNDPLFLWFLGIGVANTVVALFYYFKLPYQMYFRKPQDRILTFTAWPGTVFMAILALLLIALFFRADLLMNFIKGF